MVSSISNSMSSQYRQFQNVNPAYQQKNDVHPVKKQGMSTTGKVVVGTLSLATAVGLAVYAVKSGKLGGLKKQISTHFKDMSKEIAGIKRRCATYLSDSGHFAPKQISDRLDEIAKLPQKEQLQALQKLEESINYFKLADNVVKQHEVAFLPRGMKSLPEDVLKAYEEKDFFKAAELMKKAVEKRPVIRPQLPNKGATTAETIKNTFGENAPIKPHTYDLAQEHSVIPVYRNFGGYKDANVCRDGLYYCDHFTPIPDERFLASSISNPQIYVSSSSGSKGVYVGEGVLNIDGAKRRVVRLELDDPKRESTKMIMCLLSQGEKLTPAQKDLLKLAQNPQKVDISVFDTILSGPKNIEEMKQLGYYTKLDYDMLLSAIQTMAGKI